MQTKETIFNNISALLESHNITVSNIDDKRPWGGFFVISDVDAIKFIELFFKDIDHSEIITGKISPKILLVAPEKKLSWQYHLRRSEIWKLIDGNASIIISETDKENDLVKLNIGETIKIHQGERHRLVGLNEWGVIAEIWVHTDKNNPSDEEDIIRIQDDFGRK
jgi:mannose-6-phosphate isomerase-like protein (cupin superfamily)